MNIPTPKKRKPFNIEILKNSDLSFSNSDLNSCKLICNINDNWIHSHFNEISQEKSIPESEESDLSQIFAQLEEYDQIIQDLTNQNKDLCNLDFKNMNLTEIEAEISKTNDLIREKELDLENFQISKEEYQNKLDQGYEKVNDFKKRTIAFYNEICAWSNPLLNEKFGENEKNPEIDVFNTVQMESTIKEYTSHLQDLKHHKI